MNPLIIAIPVLVVLAAVVLFAATRRRDTGEATGQLSRETRKRDKREVATAGDEPLTGKDFEKAAEIERRGKSLEPVEKEEALVPYVPPDLEAIGVSRRQFFNRSIVGFMGFSLAGFGAAVIAFLWPEPKGGFGGKIRVGKISDILSEVEANNGFLYLAEGKMWITAYPAEAVEKAEAVYSEPELAGMRAGVVALFQKCPHLGCRVPECVSSQWFECPCHGSRYNQAGEKKGGPAPRGMDRFPMTVEGDVLSVDTGSPIDGPPIGVNTTGQESEGPSCLGAGGH